jgi:hypothetical protein
MDRSHQSSTPDAAHLTELRFDAAVQEVLAREAARSGVTVAQYVHDAVLVRAAFALRAAGEDPGGVLARSARTLLARDAHEGDRRAAEQHLIDALPRTARRNMDDAAALRAQSRQAVRRAEELRGGANAILDTVAMLVTDVLRRHGYALRAPVAARFRKAEKGNTGVEVEVRLEDPGHARAAKAAIVERFPDRLSEVIVN